MIDIVQKEDPVLREEAKEVPPEEITSPKIQKVITHMKKALASQNDGVAIAAPQIGESLRIFVVSKKVFNEYRDESGIPLEKHREDDAAFINPEIIKTSRKKRWLPEGCLSVRWLYGKHLRAEKATVRAYDEEGRRFTYGGSGLLAQIFQHEIDHLNGILFIDEARDIEEVTPEQQRRMREEQESYE